MSVGNFVKSMQNLMRGDSGVNGDEQRIEQMTWMIFLKVYDAKASSLKMFKKFIDEGDLN